MYFSSCSIDCPILLHDIAFVVVVVLVELVGIITPPPTPPPPPELVVPCVGRKSRLDCLGPPKGGQPGGGLKIDRVRCSTQTLPLSSKILRKYVFVCVSFEYTVCVCVCMCVCL